MSDSAESTATPEPANRPALSLGFTEPRSETPAAEQVQAGQPAIIPDDEPVTQVQVCPSITERGPPAELTARPQWVAFKLVPDPDRPDKPKKIPFAAPQKPASTTDPATWLSYPEAVALANQEGFAGVGYVFAPDDGITGIDLDGVRDPATGALAAWAWNTVREFDSYTEVSPSGKGLHILVRAELAAALKTGNVEVYDRARYFTVTGQVLDEYDTIREAQARVERLIARHQPKAKTSASLPPVRNTELSDQDVLNRIASSNKAKALHRLYIAGDTRPNHSGSEDDFELALLFAEQVGGDLARIERLMRGAAIADRAKWDRADYLPRTIRAALMKLPVTTTEETAGALHLTVAELLNDPKLLATPASVSPWLIWAGEYVLLAGREKDGKTTLAAADAVRAARAGHSIFWITAEEGLNRVVKRFHDLAMHDGGGPMELAALRRITVLRAWPRSWEEVEGVLTQMQPQAIYVDSLSSFLMAVDGEVPKPGEGERWQALGQRFKRWVVNTPGGVVVLAHAKKEDGSYRGSTGIGAAPDTIITLQPSDENPRARRLTTVGRWGFPSRTLEYQGDDTPGYREVADVEGSSMRLTKGHLESLQCLFEAREPLDIAAWNKLVKDRFGHGAETTRKARYLARDSSFIAEMDDRHRWQVTPAGWDFARAQRGWQLTPYEYDEGGEIV